MSEQRLAEMEQHVKDAYASLEAACEIADELGTSFGFNPAYGMGGSYVSKEAYKKDYMDDEDGEPDEDDYGWRSSSANC